MSPNNGPSRVFINCPYDSDYLKFLHAICFTVQACGFAPSCALEQQDSQSPRINRIAALVRASSVSIHDLSRMLVPLGGLPRLNMPFELGLFMGTHFEKPTSCLVLDTQSDRYRKAISDIAGHDIQSYGASVAALIACVRNFLADRRDEISRPPSPAHLVRDYQLFQNQLPHICEHLSLKPEELTFRDRVFVATRWLGHERRRAAPAS
jgi:hypothetical protein